MPSSDPRAEHPDSARRTPVAAEASARAPIGAPPLRDSPGADASPPCARIGAEFVADGVAHFRVWAPRRRCVEVVLEAADGRARRIVALHRNSDCGDGPKRARAASATDAGWFSAQVDDVRPGDLYRYRLDGDRTFPDPASRFQPQGPFGPSQLVDARRFAWSDAAWRGVRLEGTVLYELHVGTFTREGTWATAAERLSELADLGVTLLEVMPLHEFAGKFGWGYDGVDLWAPTRLYGTPEEFRAFVDRAHALGLGVLLDVVYNHFGPAGNFLKEYALEYFTDRYTTDWGEAVNYDGPGSRAVREFVVANAAYWVRDFHLDGLRLDATQNVYDASPVHVLAELTAAARAAAGARTILVVAENEPQHAALVRSGERGGFGMDAVWNDDLHHAAMVRLTGRAEAYYTDYRGSAQELVSAMRWGFLYQGQRYAWQEQRRGTPAFDLPPAAFVTFAQNHDQVANSRAGKRVHELTSPGRLRAMTALLLLGPGTPMLFQGQEWAASAPFLYFADHEPELMALVREGRAGFLRQFPSLALPEVQQHLVDPGAHETFARCKLDHDERTKAPHAEVLAMHQDLLRLRREDPVLSAQVRPEGAVLGDGCLLLRSFAPGGERLLVVNFEADLHVVPAPEPLLAPPAGMRWQVLWSSEDPRFGGGGTPALDRDEDGWHLPGEAAVLLHPVRAVDRGPDVERRGAGTATSGEDRRGGDPTHVPS